MAIQGFVSLHVQINDDEFHCDYLKNLHSALLTCISSKGDNSLHIKLCPPLSNDPLDYIYRKKSKYFCHDLNRLIILLATVINTYPVDLFCSANETISLSFRIILSNVKWI